MSIQIPQDLICPYCGFKNRLKLDVQQQFSNRFFITCDPDEGGCEKDFAIEINLKAVTYTYRLELETREVQS